MNYKEIWAVGLCLVAFFFIITEMAYLSAVNRRQMSIDCATIGGQLESIDDSILCVKKSNE